MSAVLVITKDNKQDMKVTISEEPVVIGRSKHCRLKLDGVMVSREHAEIIRESGAYWIVDKGSRTGTVVNGQKIRERHRLENGDEIGINEVRLSFLWDKTGDAEGGLDKEAPRAVVPEQMKTIQPSENGPKGGDRSSHGTLVTSAEPWRGGAFKD